MRQFFRQFFAVLALSTVMTASAFAHDALLVHQHDTEIQLAHAGHGDEQKPHAHDVPPCLTDYASACAVSATSPPDSH